MPRLIPVVLLALAAALAAAPATMAADLHVASAVEHPDATVTLPLHAGTSGGDRVWYVLLDSSDGARAARLGVNRAAKLEHAAPAAQRAATRGGVVDFPASVDFSPEHAVSAPSGFPPAAFAPGAVGEAGYSPLVHRADGTIDNAPHVARDHDGDGRIALGAEAHDKVVAIDLDARTVTLRETEGRANGKVVRYVSTEASDPLAAALEQVTYAPALAAAPYAGGDGTDSARASLAAFVNGQTGVANPQRQGLGSAVAGDGDPLNILAWTPSQGRYSPLWDVHLAAWSEADVAAGTNLRQDDFDDVVRLGRDGRVSSPDGTPFAAAGIVVNCPIIARA